VYESVCKFYVRPRINRMSDLEQCMSRGLGSTGMPTELWYENLKERNDMKSERNRDGI